MPTEQPLARRRRPALIAASIQLDLHPLGARRLFGIPLSELRGRVVHISDLFPADAARLKQRFLDTSSWDVRFDVLEAFLIERVARARVESPVVAWALRRIAETRGNLPLAELTRELGFSRKHIAALFHDQIGVAPKLWARLIRFDQFRARVADPNRPSLAELALHCGYFDQSHLTRDVRQFTGAPPSALLAPIPGLHVLANG